MFQAFASVASIVQPVVHSCTTDHAEMVINSFMS